MCIAFTRQSPSVILLSASAVLDLGRDVEERAAGRDLEPQFLSEGFHGARSYPVAPRAFNDCLPRPPPQAHSAGAPPKQRDAGSDAPGAESRELDQR